VTVNCIKLFEIMQVTGGLLEVPALSFIRKLENGAKKYFIMESQRETTSWVAFESDGGRLSGIVLN
jgi:hypothetical protein